MFKNFKVICLVIFTTISTSSYAEYSYNIDFSTPQKYVTSLNNLRAALGQPLQNIDYSGTRVYELPPQSTAVVMPGIFIRISGIDSYEGEDKPDLQFVLNPRNLYVAGFVTGNIFYRFQDMSNTTAPGVERTVSLKNSSSYPTLQPIANLSRIGMIINRSNLLDGYIHLTRFTGNNLNENTARGLLRYLTVISEAIRFRQIQRNFRIALDAAPSNYIMSDNDELITRSWSELSSALHFVDSRAASEVRVEGIYLPDRQSIIAMIAVILHCSKSNANRNTFIMSNNSDTCSDNSTVVINNVAWDLATITAAIDI